MRTRNTLTPAITIALAAVALSMLGAPPAAAHTPGPVLGVQYDLMAVDNLNLHGVVVDHDRPVWGDHIRNAASQRRVRHRDRTQPVGQPDVLRGRTRHPPRHRLVGGLRPRAVRIPQALGKDRTLRR